jgi:hypothetical protein
LTSSKFKSITAGGSAVFMSFGPALLVFEILDTAPLHIRVVSFFVGLTKTI